MISRTSTARYHQEPGPIALDRLFAQAHGVICASVTGNRRIEEAKITGMTPAMLIRNGRYVLWPP